MRLSRVLGERGLDEKVARGKQKSLEHVRTRGSVEFGAAVSFPPEMPWNKSHAYLVLFGPHWLQEETTCGSSVMGRSFSGRQFRFGNPSDLWNRWSPLSGSSK